MAKPHKTWQYVPAKPKPPQVPAVLKTDLDRKALHLIDEDLKPKHLKPPPTDERFNYSADLYGRWYRHYFYLYARYNSPGPNAISPFFEAKFARRVFFIDGNSERASSSSSTSLRAHFLANSAFAVGKIVHGHAFGSGLTESHRRIVAWGVGLCLP